MLPMHDKNQIQWVKYTVLMIMTAFLSACYHQPAERAQTLAIWQYQHKHYAAAFENFHYAAENFFPYSQYATGYMYYNGLGTRRNPVKALYWFRRAEKGYDPNATLALKEIRKSAPMIPALSGL